METHDEGSSLVALRELRQGEQRRQRELELGRLKAEQERLHRERAERQAALAHEQALSTRLCRELEVARTEIACLRSEVEASRRAGPAAASPLPVRRVHTIGWLGLSAGATMLVGALALAAAMQPRKTPTALAEAASRNAADCPKPAPVPTVACEPRPVSPAASPPPASGKTTAKPRLPPARHPVTKPAPAAACDGTDPLCGIDPNLSDEAGKRHGNRARSLR